MIELNNRYKISSGTGKGEQRITSFDSALLDAGVGNYNLVRLSSILPLCALKTDKIDLPLGSLLPIAYAVQTSNKPNTQVSAAVAIGYPAEMDNDHCGVIMEYEGECSEVEALNTVCDMVKEGFSDRGWKLDHIIMKSASAIVPVNGEYVTAFACVAEWRE